MKVAHIITGLDTGGAEMMLLKLLSCTPSENVAGVVSLMDRGALRPQFEALGVKVLSLGMKRSFPSPVSLWKLRRTLRELGATSIQGWMYHGNLAASTAASLLMPRPKVFWTVRQCLEDIAVERWLTRAVIRANALLSSTAQRIVYNSQKSRTQHEGLGFNRARACVIPNGFDCDTFRPDPSARADFRAELGLADDVILIGMVSRFHPMKDHETLFRATRILAAQHRNVCFVLVGSGMESRNAEVMRLLSAQDSRADIRLLGERPDIARINAALDIATLSSSSEAFPNVLGEAMACGVACVATDVGETTAIVGDTGLVVPPRSPERMAAAWDSLISLPRNRREETGARARERVKKLFSIESVSNQYNDLYQAAES